MRHCDTVTPQKKTQIEIPPAWWLDMEGNTMNEWGRCGQSHRKFICWLDTFDVNTAQSRDMFHAQNNKCD